MQKMIIGALAAAAALRSDPVLVTRVTSGDAITVAGVGRVSLLGIDAPPTARARERLESLVIQRWVRLEYDGNNGARASKHRAYVMLETGECVNLTLLREGLARVVRTGSFARRAEFERAEDEARRFRRGIWARYTSQNRAGGPDQPPSRRRRSAGASVKSERPPLASAALRAEHRPIQCEQSPDSVAQ